MLLRTVLPFEVALAGDLDLRRAAAGDTYVLVAEFDVGLVMLEFDLRLDRLLA
jgi:hypothetical protein